MVLYPKQCPVSSAIVVISLYAGECLCNIAAQESVCMVDVKISFQVWWSTKDQCFVCQIMSHAVFGCYDQVANDRPLRGLTVSTFMDMLVPSPSSFWQPVPRCTATEPHVICI